MEKIIIVLVGLMIVTPVIENNNCYGEVQNVILNSSSSDQKAYNYTFPKEQLHKNIVQLALHQDYNSLYKKYIASVIIKYAEFKDRTAFVELYKIELITKEEANPEKKTPLQIQKVSFDESLTNRISFEFPLAEELFESAKIVFYFSVRNANENKSVEYTVEFKDLQKQFLRI